MCHELKELCHVQWKRKSRRAWWISNKHQSSQVRKMTLNAQNGGYMVTNKNVWMSMHNGSKCRIWKCDPECHSETKTWTSNWPDRKNEWPIYMGAVQTQTELELTRKVIGSWPIDIGAAPKRKLTWKMINRCRCDPRNWTRKVIGTWPIDIGAAPTQTEHKLIGKQPINIGAAPKIQTDTKNDRSI